MEVFGASELLRLQDYGKREVVTVLEIPGDDAASDGDMVQGPRLKRGG